MVTQPTYLKDLKLLGRDDPTTEYNDALEDELYSIGNDRATAVLMGSFVERMLEQLVVSRLRNDLSLADRASLFDPDSSSGTFGAKINWAFALGLIGKSTKHDLNYIRLIRNSFAHSLLPCSFENPAVLQTCAHFEIFGLPGFVGLPLRYVQITPGIAFDTPPENYDGKTRYVAACHCLIMRMAMKRDGQPRAGDEVFPNDEMLP